MPQEELAALYNTASVFVLPSLQDGFGMVVYEAAACGLPVIVTENVGAAIRDGQDGFVVPIRDPERPSLLLTEFRLLLTAHRRGFSCCLSFPLSNMPPSLPRWVRWVHFALMIPTTPAFPESRSGRHLHYPFRGLLDVHFRCGLSPH